MESITQISLYKNRNEVRKGEAVMRLPFVAVFLYGNMKVLP